MRPAVLDFARDVAERFPLAEPVVEFGARAAEGQEHIADLRDVFRVGEIHRLRHPGGSWRRPDRGPPRSDLRG
ncbi:MAG: hypothetical protein U5R31_14415 [Acidimicrobiia bacterium]|nr:hypothetical protein [Acidimicrobiia bacterium]